ncbi:histone acetyltransferase [Malassezia vespertilionis]|uniref:Rpr2p n=1 Tax=Malassezia vespertilionis TaxID=2020962 RepID=A0A2N1J6U0_9BASI|nr:histone acetyltransferase [Malassezia vespertilionis]PKI82273.1 hypothetical protein MVES_003808 [Malassezia vespertilionis]WFD07910.1 histone acetyltransferase [Malassezia vespertilionis]
MPAHWTYPAHIASAAQCTPVSAALKVARHAHCGHGWRHIPASDSPYAPLPPVDIPAQQPCACPGATPPTSVDVASGEQQATRMDALTSAWPVCGRCKHALLEHGLLSNDPAAEQVRRTNVAVRMDELLEDEHKLLDFTYTDADLVSLKKQIGSLAYTRTPSTVKPARPTKKQAKTHAPLHRTIVNADNFCTLNYIYQRAHTFEVHAALSRQPHIARWSPSAMRHFFALAKRAVIRIDPAIKRSVCKRCMHILIEGLSCSTLIWGEGVIERRCRWCAHALVTRAYETGLPPVKRKHLSQKQRRRRWRRRQLASTPALMPSLVPYTERMQGTPWDAQLGSFGAAAPLVRQAMASRGDHVVTVGLKRGGVVGAQEAHDGET